MTWVVAAAYALSVAMAASAVGARRDARIASLLGLPGRMGPLVAAIGSRMSAPRARGLVRRLLEAGRATGSVDHVLGGKALAAVAGVMVGVASPAGVAGRLALAGVLGAAGWRLPEMVLARRASTVRARADAAIPDLLDLVAVSVSAGLAPRAALERAAGAVRGPLAGHLEDAGRAVALGSSWWGALRSVADRADLHDLRRLARALERTERLGSPVTERLRDLAREVRAERRTAAEERARRAPVAMLFPLVFLILPAFVVAAVVPAILVAVDGLG